MINQTSDFRHQTSDSRSKYKRLKKLFLSFFSLWSVVCGLWSVTSVFAQGTKEPIVVNGDKVEYLYEQKKIVGVNNVIITYKDVTLTCDKIVVHMDTRVGMAEGNVVLTQGGNIFKGQKVHYNFDTKKGTIIESEARVKPWYGKGRQTSKVDDKEYIIDWGHITTCNLPHPHYRICARRIKVFMGDRVEAYHVVVFIGKIPIFYFPYYLHILSDKRPRVTIVPGRNSTWGYYLLTAWRYYLHEWSRGYIHLDWREKKGFGTGVDYKYRAGYFGKGLARFYYTHEDHVKTLEEAASGQDASDNRWRMQLRHKWQVDRDTLAVGEFHKISDKLFIKDYFFDEEYEADRQPETFFSVIKTKPKYNLSLFFKTRTHDFFTVVERLPELELRVKSQRLRDTDFYYKSTTSYTLLQKKYDKSLYRPKLRTNRFDTDHELSYLAKLLTFLTFNPYAGIRETWYSEDARGRKNELRHIYTLGTKLSTKLYKVHPVHTNVLGLDINGLKHIITPMINYKYVSTPNIKEDNLKRFDMIDGLDSHHGISLEVVHRLQTKRGSEKKIVTLARLMTSSGVLFKPRRIIAEEREGDRIVSYFLDEFNVDLELTPYSWLLIDVDSKYSPERHSIESVNVDMVAHKEDLWRFGVGVRFEDDHFTGSSSQITTDGSYRINPKWKIKAYHRYKKEAYRDNFELEEQNYGVERDLHCWLGELNFQIKKTDGLEVDEEYRIWAVMRLKAFPDIPLRLFSAKYSAPSAGVGSARSY
ncbi:putative LPS assembly protein LptD [Omnitrophica bacterium]|nr:putative LPS assembly protein LptD [Candidatus Omnitrophota bacterium]